MYDMNQPGYANAGGWRYPGHRSSTETFYQTQPYNLAQLMAVSAKPSQGLLDKAINDPSLQAQGLLSGNGWDGLSGSGDAGPSVGGPSNSGMNDSNSAVTSNGSGIGNSIGGAIGAAISSAIGIGPSIGMSVGQSIGTSIGMGVDVSTANAPGVTSSPVSPGNAVGVDIGMAPDGSTDGGTTGVGPGNDANTDASSASATNGSDSASDAADSSGDASAASSDGADGSGWYMGGLVTPDRLHGMNPAGPDDGFGALDKGEYVINSEMTKKHGKKALKALNEGRATITMNKGK